MLDQLKQRLVALPEKKKRAQQAGRFKTLREKTVRARAQVEEALAAAHNARKIADDPAYKDVLIQVRKAKRRAESLRTKIAENTEMVTTPQADTGFGALGEHADSALLTCQKVWRRVIDNKLRGRAELASVVQRLVPRDGPEFRSTVDKLTQERERLPVTTKDAERAAQLLARFDELISQLHLEGPAGDFLQAVATDRGAPAAKLLDPEVRKFLDDHKLWTVFAVKLT